LNKLLQPILWGNPDSISMEDSLGQFKNVII
jgi:hypothetical protein